jgi:hypothetical protein
MPLWFPYKLKGNTFPQNDLEDLQIIEVRIIAICVWACAKPELRHKRWSVCDKENI